MTTQSSSPHIWKFYRAGGVDQASLERGTDLTALEGLDQKLWVALSCPTRGLEFDIKTLDYIDTDHDGRIRVPEILAALRWTLSVIKEPEDLIRRNESLPLKAINDQTPDGKKLLAAASQILATLGKSAAEEITASDTTDTQKILAQTKLNGDGVIPPESAADEAVRQVILEVIATVGSLPDRNGSAGVTQPLVDQFFAEAQAHVDWWKLADEQSPEAARILILGPATPAAFEAFAAVRTKIDDYFSRCRVAAFDPRAGAFLNRTEVELAAIAQQNLASYGPEVTALPLARVEPGKSLELTVGINPAWSPLLATFRSAAIIPLLGEGKLALTEGDWDKMEAAFQPYEAWLNAKPGKVVEKLGVDRLKAILAGASKAAITDLINQDLALAPEMAELANVDKLVRLYRDLSALLNNYTSFADFYSRDRQAIFQVGTLYLDGRSCKLCLRIEDVAKHSTVANMGGIYLAYCQCTRIATGEKMTIAAAFTAGDSDNLREGRNGIFYDRLGRDWDATIIKVLEHPISIRQAALLPYKRFARIVGQQVEKFAAARDKAEQDKMASAVESTAKAAEPGKSAAKPSAADNQQSLLGTFALLSVAIGSIGGALVGMFTKFMEKPLWQMPLLVIAVLLAISTPSMIIAWLKLRRRNLGPLLDANGWAINGMVKLNMSLGRALTKTARLPEGAQLSLEDLYPDKNPRARIWFYSIVVALGFGLGLLGYYSTEIVAKINQWSTPNGVAAAATNSVGKTNVPIQKK